MTAPELLEKTLHILQTRGWIQGDAENDHGVCLQRALWHAAGQPHNWEGAEAEAWWMLTDQAGCHIPDFNDLPTTTYEDIIQLLKDAIKP